MQYVQSYSTQSVPYTVVVPYSLGLLATTNKFIWPKKMISDTNLFEIYQRIKNS